MFRRQRLTRTLAFIVMQLYVFNLILFFFFFLTNRYKKYDND